MGLKTSCTLRGFQLYGNLVELPVYNLTECLGDPPSIGDLSPRLKDFGGIFNAAMDPTKIVLQQDSTREHIKESLQGNQTITELVFKNCQTLASDDVASFVEDINADLDALSVHNCQSFDDKSAAKISERCTKLTSISFTGCCINLSATGISSFLKNCQGLKHVTIMSTECDDESDSNNNDDDKSWALNDDIFLSFLERTNLVLETFVLCGFENITSSGLNQFLKHVSSNLKSLDLSELTAVTNEFIKELGNICSSLEDACFSHCKLTDEGVKEFCSKCKTLQSVNLSGCQDISDNSIVTLSTNCTSLKKVQLNWCVKLTEKSLDSLVANCPYLTSIDMSQCAVRHLPFGILDHFSLKELKVEGCAGLRCPPLEVALNGLESCREFLKKCNLQSLCRMTFLGDQGSGKTSLMLSLPTMTQTYADSATEGVHFATWRPFKSGKESIDLGTDMDPKMLSLTVDMWDCGGRTCLQGVHPLFLCEQSLYVIVFNVHDPFKIESVIRWMLLMRSKASASPFILIGTHADSAEDREALGDEVLQAVAKADAECRQEFQTEIDMLRGLGQEKCVESRIDRLQNLVQNWSKLPEQVFFVSTLKGKGLTEVQHAVTHTLMDGKLFPHLVEDVSLSVIYLYGAILQLRDNNVVLLSWDHYLQLASDAGVVDADLEQATAVLEYKGCILVFNIPSSHQNQGPCKTVCINPSALLNCMAGVLCETDPREYVPLFVKAGKVEKFWPTGAKPNEWTLRAAIDDIVSKGLVRESVVPLCFQIPSLLDEEELQTVIALFRSLGFLVEGAPKGNYDVELVMSQYKSCSVFKRYYVPLMTKLPSDLKDTTIWPSSLPESTIQVGWRYKFRDHVTVDCTRMLVGACANLKPSCEICAYWNSGVILKVGPVTVRMSRDGSTLDVIGRCKVTNGSKQALNMMWFVLAKFFYCIETLLMNFKGICPVVIVPIVGCNRPKHKPLYELVSEYNSQLNHHTNYRWFIPPAALDADEHTDIPSDTVNWFANIACKSLLYISYHPDQQHEVKLLKQFLDLAGFDCLGDWVLAGKTGQELTETRRNIIAGSSLFVAFITSQYLDWSRAVHDVNTALSQNKPLVYVLFDKSTWHPEEHELGALLKSHGVCLDLSAGSGSALSHQYNQGQVNKLISHCYGVLYGTGDIHPPEPPRTPEHEAQVLNNANLESAASAVVRSETASYKAKKNSVDFSDRQEDKPDKITDNEDINDQIRRMAASAVAAAVAGATAKQIANSKHSTSAIKAASAAAEVAQAVVDGNSDNAAQAVSKVAKIVEDENTRANAASTQNGSATRPPPKSSTCVLL